MSDGELLVLCEGHTDYALLKCMQQHSLLPERLELKKPPQEYGGKDRLVPDATDLLALRKSVVLVHDRDDRKGDAVAEALRRGIQASLPPLASLRAVEGRDDAFALATDETAPPRVGIVVVGLPDIGSIAGVDGIAGFAIDDYVLRLALEQAVWEASAELRGCPHATFRKKLTEVASLVRGNALELTTTKQLLQTVRLVTGFGASGATLAGKLWTHAAGVAPDRLRGFAEPLAGAFDAVVREIRGDAR